MIDKDGARLAVIRYPFTTTPTFDSSFISPDPITVMTDVSVDNRGQVWVVDHEKGKIYKFTSDLKLLAIHGREGTGYGEYNYPYGLSFAQAYKWENGIMVPIPFLAEAMLTEKWDTETGVRRVVSGVDVQSFSASYRPRLQSGEGDNINGGGFLTDVSDWRIEFYCNSVLQGVQQQLAQPSGDFTYLWPLPTTVPSGTYEVRLTVTSINLNGNTVVESRYVDVDRSIVNQRPYVDNIFFPDGDSCFIYGTPKWIVIKSHDPDGTVAGYTYDVTLANSGQVLAVHGDSIQFVSLLAVEDKGLDDHSYFRIRAVDNYGELSATLYTLKFSALTKYYPYDCICIWKPGDPDFNRLYTVSDPTYLISYIFGDGQGHYGPPPTPKMMAGDADCNGLITVSDAVYLISYIFAGGPAVQCDCFDYSH